MLIKKNAGIQSLPIKKENYDFELKSQIVSFQQWVFWSPGQNSYYFLNTDWIFDVKGLFITRPVKYADRKLEQQWFLYASLF